MSKNFSFKTIKTYDDSYIMPILDIDNAMIYAIPTLDIEELLDKKPWKGGKPLTEQETHALHEADIFLEKVVQGREIIRRSRAHGVIQMNLSSVEAYNFACKALKYLKDKEYQNIDEFFKIAESVLSSLASAPDEDVDKVHDFFYYLSFVSPYC